MNREHRTIAASIVAGVVAAIPIYVMARQEPVKAPTNPPQQRIVDISWVPEVPDVTIEPETSAAEPTLTEEGEEQIQRRVSALAGELSRMWTRSPERLVRVIDRASRAVDQSPPVTLLLAIAHAETNGKILDVSEAGAVGLAQATPVAYRQEEFTGKLFVTDDYVNGARAYMVKKPLGDAYKIATVALQKKQGSLARARKLLRSANVLRREGLDELDHLRPFAPDSFYDGVERSDEYNRETLAMLADLLETGEREPLEKFRDRMKAEYTALREEQTILWRSYQRDLVAERDALLISRFGAPMKTLDEELVYEASEYLARKLDDRFSATHMASFLVQHLETKRAEAKKLARASSHVERMTAALYNGGSHNVKRMLAGLIASLPETDKYMKKVPATRRRLDAQVARAEASANKSDRLSRRAR